jgi:hypothetical protein
MKKGFDDIIKEKLIDIKFDESNDWESFSKIVDEEVISNSEDSQFDKVISSKLNQNYVPYNSSHWTKLKSRLENEEKAINRIYTIKVIEFVAVLILIFIGNSFEWFKIKVKNDYYFAANQQHILNTETDIAIFNNNPLNIIKDQQNLALKLNHKVSEETASQSQNNLNALSKTIAKKVNGESISHNNFSHGITITKPVEDQANILQIPHIILSSIAFDNSRIGIPDYLFANTIDPILPLKENIKSRIGVYASLNKVQVNTPFDKIYNVESYSSTTSDLELGLTLGQPLSNSIEIETGLGFNAVSYKPQEISNKSDVENTQYETNIANIRYDIANVPLYLKYYYMQNQDISLYLLGGLKANVIVNADYEVNKTLTNNERNEINSLADGAVATRLKAKDFNLGIIEGGDLVDNFYLNAEIGFGIEKKFGDSFSLNMQPKYSRLIFNDGLGPNNDKLHTASLTLGLKYIL